MTLLILQLFGLILISIGSLFLSNTVKRWGAKKTRPWKYGNALQIAGLFLSIISILLKNFSTSSNLLNESWSVQTILAFLTLLLLTFYTYYTRQIAQGAAENLRPIVSCVLKSGKNYYTSIQIQHTSELKFDTRCIVSNHSKYNLEVFVNLNIKVNDKFIEINDLYTGKDAWPLTSYQEINGHFDFSDGLNINNSDRVTIELEVKYKSNNGKIYLNPTQHWFFDRKQEIWLNEIGLTV